jgi:hypothetical protein
MGKIDFTEWTESDPNSKLTVTADKVQWDLLENGDVGLTDYDFGAGFFNEDMLVEFDMLMSTITYIPANTAYYCPISFSNALGGQQIIRGAGNDAIALWGGELDSADPFGLNLEENNQGSFTGDSTSLSRGNVYYCTFARDESVGAFGTAYLDIYTDSAKTVLFDSLVVTLTKKMDLQYGVVCNTWDNGTTSYSSGYVENLDIDGINDSTAFIGSGLGDESSYM